MPVTREADRGQPCTNTHGAGALARGEHSMEVVVVNSEEAGMGSHLAVLMEGFSILYFQNCKVFVLFDPVISLQEMEPKKSEHR